MACTSIVGLYDGPSMSRWLAPTKLMPTARSADNRQTRGSLVALLNLCARERTGEWSIPRQLSAAEGAWRPVAAGGSRSGWSGWRPENW